MTGLEHEERFSMKAERPLQISKRTVGEYSVGGMVLVACDLNLHTLPLILLTMDLRLDVRSITN